MKLPLTSRRVCKLYKNIVQTIFFTPHPSFLNPKIVIPNFSNRFQIKRKLKTIFNQQKKLKIIEKNCYLNDKINKSLL